MKKEIILRSLSLSILIHVLSFSVLNAQHSNPSHKMTKITSGGSVDTTSIQNIIDIKGKANKGEYKITVPQNDLNVMVDGFRIIPAMGLGTWVAFTPSAKGVMMMGDIILTEIDLKPVQQEVFRQDLTITAIHNHFVRNDPNVLYMHIDGSGKTEEMATKAKAVLDKEKDVRGNVPAKGTASSDAVENSLDTNQLKKIVGGASTDTNKGVFRFTIGRPDVKLSKHGTPISTFLGFDTWAAFQGTPDKAAVAGDFTLLGNEEAPVIKALVEMELKL